MELVAEYRRRAADAERLAECALWEEQRRLILEMARIWRMMADQRELRLKTEVRRAKLAHSLGGEQTPLLDMLG